MTSIECITYICKHYGIQQQNISPDTSIVDALKSCGIYACEIRTGMKGLAECPMPVIIETIEGHLVVTQANNFFVTVFDHGNKTRRIAFLDFIRLWTGSVVVIEAPPLRWSSLLRRIFRF